MKSFNILKNNFNLKNYAKTSFVNYSKKNLFNKTKEPVRVAVTGASGNIAYSLAFRIARYDNILIK